MLGYIDRIISAWQMVVRRSLSHWRLLASVVLGVLLASAIMAGTVIYFDALRELALRNSLAEHTDSELDILVQGQRGPAIRSEFDRVSALINNEVDAQLGWLITDRFLAAKSPTFFLSKPGEEHLAGDDNARTYFAFAPRLDQHITVLPGGQPPAIGSVAAPGQPTVIEALVPEEAASLFGVGVGDVLIAVPPWKDVTPNVTVKISGLFTRNDPAAEFWRLEKNVLGTATGASFRTIPFHIPQETFHSDLGTMFRKMDGIYAWLLMVDSGRINAPNAVTILSAIDALDRNLAAAMASFRLTTALDGALEKFDRRLFFSKLPMFVVLIVIAIVILYYVATLSSLVVEDRRSEIALLRSRGATSAQILAVFVMEGSTISVLAVLVGPILAATTITVLGYTPAFSGLTEGGRLTAEVSGAAYLMSGVGGVLSFAALIFPAVNASRIGVTRHRQQSARPVGQPLFQRYYVDVLLLLISIFLFHQLTEQGSLVAVSVFGEVTADQLLLALPGLILLASAMVLLRLFPVAMNLVSGLASKVLPIGIVMGVWQIARNPTHYARLSLLLILTAGLGIFASSFGATLELSFIQRVLYATGSDIRLDGVRPAGRDGDPLPFEAYEDLPGVLRASPVLQLTGHDLTRPSAQNYTMLAVDGETFSEVAWFRDDFADEPMDGLLKSLKLSDTPRGLELPEDALWLNVTIRPDRAHPTLELTARVVDELGTFTTLRLGRLESDSWSGMAASLPNGEPPFRLVSLMVHERRGVGGLVPGTVILDDIFVGIGLIGTEGVSEEIIESFDDPDSWTVIRTNTDAESDILRSSDMTVNGGSSVAFTWSRGSSLVGHGISYGPEWSRVPVLASETFAKASGHLAGDKFDVTVSGLKVPVRLVSIIEMFPTMVLTGHKYLISDMETLTTFANVGTLNRELQPNGVWISTDVTDEFERQKLLQGLGQVTGFSVTSINDRAGKLADSEVDPLVSAGWRALLFIAFAAVLILSCLGFLVHAYVSFRSRELQFALLRTVGFSLRQLVTMVWLEQTLVIAVGMALGTWMGGRLGATIMPFLGHDDWGDRVVPPFVLEVNWGALLLTYTAMIAVFAVISLGLIWLVQRISLQRIMRLGEM